VAKAGTRVEEAYKKGATLFIRKPANYLDYVSLLRSLLNTPKEAENSPGDL